MTTEQLLKPRYKVIANYPDSLFDVGSILEQDFEEPNDWIIEEKGLMSPCLQAHPSRYPAIFRELEWWEDRELSEIEQARYLKYKSMTTQKFVHFECKNWRYGKHPYAWREENVLLFDRADGTKEAFENYMLPSTLSDYTAYINQTNQTPNL